MLHDGLEYMAHYPELALVTIKSSGAMESILNSSREPLVPGVPHQDVLWLLDQ
jgi:hypothetical protein